MSAPLLTPAKAPARPSASGKGLACTQLKKSFSCGVWLRLTIADRDKKNAKKIVLKVGSNWIVMPDI
jgi:hypothetical protein